MKEIIVDFGHSGVKASDCGKNIFIPSLQSLDHIEANVELSFDNESKLIDNLQVEIDGQQWVIGELAKDCDITHHKFDDKTVMSDYARRLILSSIALLVDGEEHVKLLSNLPTNQYSNIKKEFKAKYKDTYTIGVYDYNKEKYVDKTFTIEQIDLKPQGFLSLANYVLGPNGDFRADRKEVAKGYNVTIDVGYYSSDLYISDKMAYQRVIPTQKLPGMSKANRLIAKQLKKRFSVNKKSWEVEPYVKQQSIDIGPRTHNIKPLLEPIYKNIAGAISNEIRNLVDDIAEVNYFILAGGGATALKSYFEAELATDDNVLITDDPRFSNVNGGRKWIKRQEG